MARLRYNGLSATLGADLTSSGTTITFTAALSSAAGAVPTIAGSDYIPLTILTSTGGVSEIVYLTAYTSGATTGTIARGKEGTTGVAHTTGDGVVNAGTVNDSNRAVGAQAYNNAGTSIANNSETKIPLASENFDTDAFHDPATNNTRLTVPTGSAGYYLIHALVVYTYSATGSRTAAIFINNVKMGEGAVSSSVSSSPFFTFPAYLAEGDYVEMATYQDSGVALALNNSVLSRLTLLRISS